MLKGPIEEYVRAALAARFGQAFTKIRLTLPTGGLHEFDAVSADRSIVASIKSSTGLTSGGKNPSGKIHSSVAEMYFLSMITASRRLLILTDADFHRILTKTMNAKIGHDIELLLIPLPETLQKVASAAHRLASEEISALARSTSSESLRL